MPVLTVLSFQYFSNLGSKTSRMLQGAKSALQVAVKVSGLMMTDVEHKSN